jgi:cytochrome c peroxidase
VHSLIALGLAATVVSLAPAPQTQLSPLAAVGRHIFFDPTLSASGKLSCSSCHDPANAYAAPATAGVVMRGGADGNRPGLRTVPTLRYLSDTPRFARHTYLDTGREREDIGPAGGLMLDGRADDLRQQALIPLLDAAEMANRDIPQIATRLRHASYAEDLEKLAGASATDSQSLVETATTAVEQFELEDVSFHPYSSRFDQYLRGTASFSADELEGFRLFTTPGKGNCIACHTAATGPGGQAPLFTDHSYHALGVPRNPAIPANRNPQFFDMGLCGPKRHDLKVERQYCGYFKTPTLRNVARRHFFFHNGHFATLEDVMHFYVERDTSPQRWYPTQAGGLLKFDDLPGRYRGNVNTSDAPLNREQGEPPALDAEEIRKVIAFLKTLSDTD